MRPSRLPQAITPFSGDFSQGQRDLDIDALKRSLEKVPRPFLLTGTADPQSPRGVTDGIQFVGGQTVTLDHGADGEVVSFLEVPMLGETDKPGLTPAWSSEVDARRQLRVTAANTARCHLLLFVRS